MINYDSPMGPGWFILFRQVKGGSTGDKPVGYDKALKDDEEMIEILTMVLNCDVTC